MFRLLVNNFLIRPLSESRIRWTCSCHFHKVICFKMLANLTGNIEQSLTWSMGFFNGIRLLLFCSHVILHRANLRLALLFLVSLCVANNLDGNI